MDKSKDGIREIIIVDGCKVVMTFTHTSKPEVMERVKDTLFHIEHSQHNAQEICNIL